MKDIESVRQGILQGLLKLTAAVGLLALGPSLWACVVSGLWSLLAIDCLVYAWILCVAFLPSVSHSIRLFSVIAMGLVLGSLVMAFAGANGAGYVWLTFSVLVAALLGRRGVTIGTFAATILIMLAYAGASALGLVPNPQIPAAVLVIASNLVLVFAVLVFVIRRLLSGLEANLAESREAATSLELELGKNEGLLKELNHRVRNNMQLSLSLVAIEAAQGEGSREEALATVERKLRALAVTNDLIIDGTSLELVELRDLVRLVAFSEPTMAGREKGGREKGGRQFWAVGDFSLKIGAGEAIAVGLAVSEIVHALEGPGGGRIDLEDGDSGPQLLFRAPAMAPVEAAETAETGRAIVDRLASRLGAFLPADSLSLAPAALGIGLRYSLMASPRPRSSPT